MKETIYLLTTLLLTGVGLSAQPFASWTKTQLKLSNGIVERIIELPGDSGHFLTTSYKPVNGPFNYFTNRNTDFQFVVDDSVYSGNSNWRQENITCFTDAHQGDGAAVTLISSDNKIELAIEFLLYPGQPVIRKNLVLKNLSLNTLRLESVDIEKFNMSFYNPSTFSWICHDYGRRRSIGPYDGNMQDALVIVHNSDWQQGIIVGNESAGVIKHTSAFWNEESLCSGLTHSDARYPFRKFINKDESFTSPQVFTIIYNDHKDPDEMLNTAVPEFIGKYLGSKISELKHQPTFVYNTWVPFKKNINEKLIMELAKSAAAAGMKEFIIDDGWQENYGDWVIDKNKFPKGLKPVFNYIKSLGMKPGLWISVGSASPASNVFKTHPEWFLLDEKQQPTNLHIEDTTLRTACFGTGWYDYIKNILMKLCLEYGLEYMKLDFTVVTSPYRFTAGQTGCYALNHPGHKDHNESLYSNYEQVWKLFDELHEAKSDLFIDCTFETMGGLQLIDYAMLKHADGNWLSNFHGPDSKVDLRIRNMAWWRSPALPAAALVIGNPEMQDNGWEIHIKSLAGALPIMLGDPRKLTAVDFKKYRSYADWLQLMEKRYNIMSFRQDLQGFGEPVEGSWDGFQRVNTQNKSGGIVGIFRHGSMEMKRVITILYLDKEKIYEVKNRAGIIVAVMTGFKLATVGFPVVISKPYDGDLFEVTRQN